MSRKLGAIQNATQELLAGNTRARRGMHTNDPSPHLLKGLVVDDTGDRLTTIHANKKGRKYYYYISSRLTGSSRSKKDGWRIPARQLEQPVVQTIKQLLADPIKLGEFIELKHHTVHQQEMVFETAKHTAAKLRNSDTAEAHLILKTIIDKITLNPTSLKIEVNISKLNRLLRSEEESSPTEADTGKSVDSEIPNTSGQNETWRENQGIHIIEIKHQNAKRGVEAKLILENPNVKTANPDQTLIDIIAKAHLWISKLTDGSADSIHDLSKQLHHDPSEISRFLLLAFLAPDTIESILTGSQPINLTQEKLRRISKLPIDWNDQR